MGAGQQGPEGPVGPKGADASPAEVANILITSKENDLLNKLAKAVSNLQGENSISSVAAKAFIDKVPDDFPVRVGNSLANNPKFTNTLAESMNKMTGENSVAALAATKFYSNLPSTFTDSVKQSMISNVDFQTSLADKLSENPTMLTNVSGLLADSSKNATFVSTLTGDNKLIDNIANTLSNNDTYKNRLRGPPGTFGNETAIKTALSKYVMLCNTAGSCNMPNESKAQLNISNDDTYQFTNSNKNGYGNVILGVNNQNNENVSPTAGSLFIRNGDWREDIAQGSGKTKFNSAIVNDTGDKRLLMILGNGGGSSGKREVGIWDNLSVAENLNAGATITGKYINSSGDIKANNTLVAGNNVDVGGAVNIGKSKIWNGTQMEIDPNGGQLNVNGVLNVGGSKIWNGGSMVIDAKGGRLDVNGSLVTSAGIATNGGFGAGPYSQWGVWDGDSGGRIKVTNRIQIGDWIIYQDGSGHLGFWRDGNQFRMYSYGDSWSARDSYGSNFHKK